MTEKFDGKQFAMITLVTSIWIHIGEVLRALFVAFPRMEAFFAGKVTLIGANDMQISHALIWGVWDTMLTAVLVFLLWLCVQVFGNNKNSVLIAASVTAVATLGVFWVGTVNTGLGEWSTAFVIMPIVWVEFVVGAVIAANLYERRLWAANL